jgi:intracellular multiplication protein IcmK
MRTSIALAVWLVAGSYAWAADPVAGENISGTAPNGWQTAASPATPSAPVSAGGTAAAQSEKAPSGNDSLPPPPRSMMLNRALESVTPLSPQEVRVVLGEQNAVKQAMSSQQVAIVPKISALTVDLSPGASLPLSRTAVNYPSSITFIDSTGAPWNLGAAPISGNPAFVAYWVPKTPVMVVYASEPYVSGNITVYLEGLSVPVVINVTSGEADTTAKTWTVDSRLDLRLPRRGPNALAGAAPQSRIGLHDSTLQAFLDGIPPKDARRLKTSGEVPETTVWQLGDDLYIRSRADIRDEFEATLSSADGTHLWKLPVTPYVSFSVMGKTSALNVALE